MLSISLKSLPSVPNSLEVFNGFWTSLTALDAFCVRLTPLCIIYANCNESTIWNRCYRLNISIAPGIRFYCYLEGRGSVDRLSQGWVDPGLTLRNHFSCFQTQDTSLLNCLMLNIFLANRMIIFIVKIFVRFRIPSSKCGYNFFQPILKKQIGRGFEPWLKSCGYTPHVVTRQFGRFSF